MEFNLKTSKVMQANKKGVSTHLHLVFSSVLLGKLLGCLESKLDKLWSNHSYHGRAIKLAYIQLEICKFFTQWKEIGHVRQVHETGHFLFASIEPRQANLCLRAFRHDKFQLRMPSHSEGLGNWLSVWRFLLTHCMYKRAAKVLARLRGCAGSPEPSLLT